jgi:hypothetical protein
MNHIKRTSINVNLVTGFSSEKLDEIIVSSLRLQNMMGSELFDV